MHSHTWNVVCAMSKRADSFQRRRVEREQATDFERSEREERQRRQQRANRVRYVYING